jgi:hypothetical protein
MIWAFVSKPGAMHENDARAGVPAGPRVLMKGDDQK